jgi:hypothetical protein
MKITLSDIEEMTHDELATACYRDGDPVIQSLGEELREAVDAESESQEVVERITAHITGREA